MDRDKPLKENPPKVIEAINHLAEDKDININGWDSGAVIYDLLHVLLGSDQEASKILNEYGIPGLTYIGDRRLVEGGARDFVTWNTDLLKIMGVEGDARVRRNG